VRCNQFRPGGAIGLLDTAIASERDRRKVVRALKAIRTRAVQAVIDVGEERRADGKAVALCWLPNGNQTVLSATPQDNNDGKSGPAES
jgi:hypothetical protein